MTRVKVGNAEIESILDLAFAFPYGGAFPAVSAEAWEPYKAIYPRCWTADGSWQTNAQAFLVRSAGQNVLVDTGLGPGPHQMTGGTRGALADSLQASGVKPEEVALVILTHLHFDHSGWAAVDGKPFFPKARYILPEADWAHLGNAQAMFAPREGFEAIQAAGRVELVSGEKSLTPEISLVPTPGHTPGHQSVIVASAGERAAIMGDLFNHPAQAHETDWNAGFDFDQEQARATRRRMFERWEQEGHVLANGHFPAPGFGRLVRENGRRVFRAL